MFRTAMRIFRFFVLILFILIIAEGLVQDILSRYQAFIINPVIKSRKAIELILNNKLAAGRALNRAENQLAPNPIPTNIPPSPTPPPVISESELFQALSTYRQSHGQNSLVYEVNLCNYARFRVAELQTRLATLSPDDSPLDNHSGFQRDADSGKVFQITDMASVAENLAYLPYFANATQIIEWGWDTSSAHRDAQLSNEWTHVCISGKFPFYVGIFGHH